MRNVKAMFAGLAAASVSMAAITGRVTDTSGTAAISGAVVQLEKGGQPVTTDANGNFTLLVSTNISSRINQSPRENLSATIEGGLLRVNVAEKSAIEIAAFSLHGKALSILQQTMNTGTHSIALPHVGTGVYLYKVKAGGNEFVLKGNSIGWVYHGAGIASHHISTNTALSKEAKAATAINDVIAVTKSGYLNYRVIVTNSDTSGIEIKMIVSGGTVTDVDGNVYQTVKIGNQEWTAENLRTTKYSDGTVIPFDTSTVTWANATTPKYCYYRNTANVDSIKKFGTLYNWYIVNPGNPKRIAPAGWHMPTDAEWDTLMNYLVAHGYNWDGTATDNRIAKSLAAKADWHTYTTTSGVVGNDLAKNNRSGFTAFPGGYRGGNGGFGSVGYSGYWWSATEDDASQAWYRYLSYGFVDLYRDYDYKSCGFSVRVVKD
jgi:uncharacterized protein (TIGR02145 family)